METPAHAMWGVTSASRREEIGIANNVLEDEQTNRWNRSRDGGRSLMHTLKGFGAIVLLLSSLFSLGHIGAWVEMRIDSNPNHVGSYYGVLDRFAIGTLIVLGCGVGYYCSYMVGTAIGGR